VKATRIGRERFLGWHLKFLSVRGRAYVDVEAHLWAINRPLLHLYVEESSLYGGLAWGNGNSDPAFSVAGAVSVPELVAEALWRLGLRS
jgi:hypothetical protein